MLFYWQMQNLISDLAIVRMTMNAYTLGDLLSRLLCMAVRVMLAQMVL